LLATLFSTDYLIRKDCVLINDAQQVDKFYTDLVKNIIASPIFNVMNANKRQEIISRSFYGQLQDSLEEKKTQPAIKI